MSDDKNHVLCEKVLNIWIRPLNGSMVQISDEVNFSPFRPFKPFILRILYVKKAKSLKDLITTCSVAATLFIEQFCYQINV